MKKISDFAARLWAVLRSGRFFAACQMVVGGIFPARVLSLKKTILYRLLRENVETPEQADEDLEISTGDETAVRGMVRDLYGNDARTLDFYLDFLRQGFEPWLARHGQSVVGVVWLFPRDYLLAWEGYDAWVIRVSAADPNGRFVGNVFVSSSLRGKKIFTRIANRCFAAYPQSPFYSTVDEFNTPSNKSHEKIGFEKCGTVRYLRFFGLTLCLYAVRKKMPRLFRIKRGVAVDVVLS